MSDLGHHHDVVHPHLEVLVHEVRSIRSVHVTTPQALEGHHLAPKEKDSIRQLETATKGQDLLEEHTRRHVMVIVVDFDQDPVLLLDALTALRI
jgi:hypothetical protein